MSVTWEGRRKFGTISKLLVSKNARGCANAGERGTESVCTVTRAINFPAFAGSEADAALLKCCHWRAKKKHITKQNPTLLLLPTANLSAEASWAAQGAPLLAGLLQKSTRLESGEKQCADERTFSHKSRGQAIMMGESKSTTSHL